MDVTELFIKRTCWSRILGWPSDKTKWHHSLWCWWVQKVKVNQIINAQFLQGQHLHWFESNIKICVKLNLFCAIPKWFGSDFFQAPPRPDWSARSLDMFAPSALSWRPFQHMTNLFWTAEYAGVLQNWVSTYTCLLSVETSDLKKNSYSQQRDRFKNSPLKNPSNSQSWQQALVAEKEPLMGKIDSNRNAAKQACFFLFAFGSPFYKRSDSKKNLELYQHRPQIAKTKFRVSM